MRGVNGKRRSSKGRETKTPRAKKIFVTTSTAKALESTQRLWEPLLERAMFINTVKGQVSILEALRRISTNSKVFSILVTRWSQKAGYNLAEEAYAKFIRRQKN